MTLADTPSEASQISEILPTRRAINSKAGLASLVLTLVELIRQLMEAQVIRRMDEQVLSETELDAAAESLQKLEAEILRLCDIFEIDPNDLNLDLGEVGTLLPKTGSYYPGEPSQEASILELLDRLLNVGIVVQGDLDLGVANLNLIQAKIRLVLTSQPL